MTRRPTACGSIWLLCAAAFLPGRTAPAQDEAAHPGAPGQKEYTFDTGVYSVRIDGNGLMTDLRRNDGLAADHKAPRTLLVKKLWWGPFKGHSNVDIDPPVLADVTPTGKNEVTAVFASHIYEGSGAERKLKETMPEAYRVVYSFDGAEVKVLVRARHMFRVDFELGADGQIAELTKQDKRVSLPALKGFGAGWEWRFTYLDGTELLFRYQGPGNDFQDHGALHGPTGLVWGRGWGPQNYDFIMNFRVLPGAQDQKVLSSPSFDATTPHKGHIFFDQDEKRFRLTFKRSDYQKILDNDVKDTRVEYRVTDHRRRELAAGSLPIDFRAEGAGDASGGEIVKELAIPVARRGYFDAQFRIVDGKGSLRGIWITRRFSVLEAIDPPAVEHETNIGEWEGGWGNDYRRNGFLGLGLQRISATGQLWHEDGKWGHYDPEKNEYHWDDTERWLRQTKEKSDRFGVPIHVMLNGCEWAKTPKDQYEFFKAHVSRFKDYVKVWETVNEPTITMRPAEYLEMHLKPLCAAVRESDPQARVLAPSCCGWTFDWLEELFKLGGGDYLDGISIHPYQGTPYDQTFVPLIERLQARAVGVGEERRIQEGWLKCRYLLYRNDTGGDCRGHQDAGT